MFQFKSLKGSCLKSTRPAVETEHEHSGGSGLGAQTSCGPLGTARPDGIHCAARLEIVREASKHNPVEILSADSS